MIFKDAMAIIKIHLCATSMVCMYVRPLTREQYTRRGRNFFCQLCLFLWI